MQKQVAKVEELKKQVGERNETIIALQKQLQACMASMRGGRALVLALEGPSSPSQSNNRAMVTIPSQQVQQNTRGEPNSLAVVEELKRTFKADAAEMRADFEKHIARLCEVPSLSKCSAVYFLFLYRCCTVWYCSQ
jgi:hypothetical protein